MDAVRAAFANTSVPRHVLAAVSGGSDSTALLVLLKAALPESETRLAACHVDHGLRAAAAMEAALVEGLCRRLGVVLVRADMGGARAVSEADLREARYAALARHARDAGANYIATGHTRDDQIETILFRLVRGSSRGGLGGIPSHRDSIVRPLLSLGRAELRSCLVAAGIAWSEDPSNDDRRYARNRIRHVVVPALEYAMGRGRLLHLPDVAEIWRAEDDYLDGAAARYGAYAIRGHGSSAVIDQIAFQCVPPGLQARVLRMWLETCGFTGVTVGQLKALAELARSTAGSASLSLPGVRVVREYGRIRAVADEDVTTCADLTIDLDRPAAYEAPGGEWCLDVDPDPQDESPDTFGIHRQVIEFPIEALATPLRLRGRRPGDTIRTREHGRRKVHDIMIEARVPRRARASWPIVTSAETVIWVPGLAVAMEMESAKQERGALRVRLAWRRRSF